MNLTILNRVFNVEKVLPRGMFEACIDNMAPYASEIIIIEGASYPPAKDMTPDGHSTDGTMQIVQKLALRYPNQVKVIQSPEGFWPYGTGEQYKAVNRNMSGDYVWILDSDEFYKKKDIGWIIHLLKTHNPYMVAFYANQFWGDWNHRIDDRTGHLWGNELPWMRIFRNKPGVSYFTEHHPPTMVYEFGRVCNDQSNVLSREHMLELGIKMYHYGFVARSQVEFKQQFYQNSWPYVDIWDKWQKDHSVKLPYETQTCVFDDTHPEIILERFPESKKNENSDQSS